MMSGPNGEAFRVQSGTELGHLLMRLGPEDTLRGMFFRSVQDTMLTLLGEKAMEACLEECTGEREFVDDGISYEDFAVALIDAVVGAWRGVWLIGGDGAPESP